MLQLICKGIFSDRPCGILVYVDCHDFCCAGSRASQRKNAGSRANVCDTLAPQVEPRNKRCKEFTRKEISRVKDRRPHDQVKAGRARHARSLPLQNKMICKEVDGAAKESSQITGRRTWSAEFMSVFDDVNHEAPRQPFASPSANRTGPQRLELGQAMRIHLLRTAALSEVGKEPSHKEPAPKRTKGSSIVITSPSCFWARED